MFLSSAVNSHELCPSNYVETPDTNPAAHEEMEHDEAAVEEEEEAAAPDQEEPPHEEEEAPVADQSVEEEPAAAGEEATEDSATAEQAAAPTEEAASVEAATDNAATESDNKENAVPPSTADDGDKGDSVADTVSEQPPTPTSVPVVAPFTSEDVIQMGESADRLKDDDISLVVNVDESQNEFDIPETPVSKSELSEKDDTEEDSKKSAPTSRDSKSGTKAESKKDDSSKDGAEQSRLVPSLITRFFLSYRKQSFVCNYYILLFILNFITCASSAFARLNMAIAKKAC